MNFNSMMPCIRFFDMYVTLIIWIMLRASFSHGVQSDVDCLKSIKASLEDPFGYFNTTWTFDSQTEGYICKFTGVECWHPDENKVLNIRLSDMGLKGPFPRGIANCTSLTGLYLSSNKLLGHIPKDISKLIPFVTSLDLSSNKFSGPIPAQLSNCTYLNDLKLDQNRLSGLIPPQLAFLRRLKQFNVSNNRLTGPVPNFKFEIKADSYANNSGLCGGPLEKCPNA